MTFCAATFAASHSILTVYPTLRAIESSFKTTGDAIIACSAKSATRANSGKVFSFVLCVTKLITSGVSSHNSSKYPSVTGNAQSVSNARNVPQSLSLAKRISRTKSTWTATRNLCSHLTLNCATNAD